MLLWRLTGRPELAVGVVYDGRKFEELRDAPGLFARTLPVPVGLEEGLRFSSALARLHAATAERHEWQEYFSWERLPEAAETPAGPPFLPFAFERRPPSGARCGGGVTFAVRRRHACCDRFLLKLVVDEREDGPAAVEVWHDASRVDPEAAARVAERLVALLGGLAARPDATVEELPVVGEGERRRLLFDLNDTAVELPGEKLLHRLVEAQAARTPGRIAVEAEDRRLTYAELEALSESLAVRLARLGVGPEVRVGVCLDRSPEMVVALLAVLKAGGAWLPLDPSYPLDRLTYILDDARPAVLVLGPGAPAGLLRPAVRNLDLRAPAAAVPDVPDAPAPSGPAVTPENLAYVIYTSGSTGRPKGVMVPHRAIANRLLWMQSAFPLGEQDAVLQKTPFGFDASIWEVFVPLLAGAKLVLARPGGHQDAGYLARTVAQHGITVLQLVPSLLGPFLAEEEADRGRLARLFCGGEALASDLAERALALLPAELCNLYGPTETAIDATFRPCPRGDAAAGATVPIGRPIANVRVHLLDARGWARAAGCPRRTPRRRCRLGAGLPRPRRPDRGALRPGSLRRDRGEPGARLYKTGDLARYREDGSLEFLGRIDHQVKIRGTRIELAEVEAWLARHPEIGESVVAAREDAPGDRRLVAYFTRLGDAAPEPDELRAFLAVKLPEVMVPSAYVELPALPRLASGKVDRAALPAPELGSAGGYVGAAHADRAGAGGSSGPRCSASSAWVSSTTSLGSGGTPCWPPSSSPGCGGSSGSTCRCAACSSSRLSPRSPSESTARCAATRLSRRRRSPGCRATGRCRSPSPSSASGSSTGCSRGARSTTCRSPCASPARSIRRRWRAAWRRPSGATRSLRTTFAEAGEAAGTGDRAGRAAPGSAGRPLGARRRPAAEPRPDG